MAAAINWLAWLTVSPPVDVVLGPLVGATGVPDGLRAAYRFVPLVRAWAGLRPRSGDGRFIIGPAPGLEGFWLATGHDSIGILYSTMTGKLLASFILSGRRPDMLAPFDPARPSLVTRDGGH